MDTHSTVINGVDCTALGATIDAVKSDPALAKFEFRLENEWIGGGLNRSTVRDFHGTREDIDHAAPFSLLNDEPPVLLSNDVGPNPVENLLHALAGCLTTSLVYHAAAKGVRVDAVRTRFTGDLDLQGFLGLSDKVRKGYRSIAVEFDIEGDLSADERKELIATAQQYSPVFDVVTNGTKVECRLKDQGAAATIAA